MPANEIVLASSNQGKLREIQTLLNDSGLELTLRTQSELEVEEIPETGLGFIENALLKARNASQQTGLPALADDSGIVVDALNGEPGIYSARYAGEGASDEDNLQKLIAVVKSIPEAERTAQFVCVLVFVSAENDPMPIIAEGIWRGHVLDEARGENGFGYDPMFYVPEQNCTSAELSAAVKNTISHRGQALAKMIQSLKTRYQ